MSMRWAAIDIGSNTLITLVADRRQGVLQPDGEWFRTTRLGEGVETGKQLSKDARRRTLQALEEQLTQLRSSGHPGQAYAVATSAVREAADGGEFLQECADILGGRPVCLTGEEEARYAWRGALADVTGSRPVLQVDIGAGSTELSAGQAGGDCAKAVSLPIGAARLADTFGLRERAEPRNVQAARRHIAESLGPVLEEIRCVLGCKPELVVASGGTATTFAAMDQALAEYDAERIHACTVSGQAIRTAAERLTVLDCRQRAEIPGVPEDRAAIFPAGVLILDQLLVQCGLDEVRISTRGIRFGIVMALAAGDIEPLLSW